MALKKSPKFNGWGSFELGAPQKLIFSKWFDHDDLNEWSEKISI